MPVLQEYYTSYSNEVTRTTGYQVKAISPGIGPDLQAFIGQFIAYRIPPSLDPRAIDTHPVALRYFYNYNKPGESLFLCSQSTGRDELERPGNYFAHALVMGTDIFSIIPPIFYWCSPFWQRTDAEQRPRIDSLPILPSFNEVPLVDIERDIEGMWAFLAQGPRRTWFYKLLCAAVHSQRTRRRIVILDATENVVWWIKLLSFLLPPDYRPFLSFATYHHNVADVPYLITGTTHDWFRNTRENYGSYFVLNAYEGSLSEVEDSPYAQMVAEVARPDTYESDLIPLLTYARRFPSPTAINQQLDLVMLYAKIQKRLSSTQLSASELQAIHLAVDTFEKLSALDPEDSAELQCSQTLLEAALRHQLPTTIQPALIQIEWQRIDTLLKQQQMKDAERFRNQPKRPQNQPGEPMDEPSGSALFNDKEALDAFLAQEAVLNERYLRGLQQSQQHPQHPQLQQIQPNQQPDTNEQLQIALKTFMNAFDKMSPPRDAQLRFEQLRQQFGDTMLAEYINQPTALNWLIQQVIGMPAQQSFQLLCYFWRYLGRYLQPEPENWSLLSASLNEVNNLDQEDREEDSDELLNTITSAMAQRKQRWLELVVQRKATLSGNVAQRFYDKCVETLALDKRSDFRTIALPLFKDVFELLTYELERGLDRAKAKNELLRGPALIKEWLEHARQNGYDVKKLKDVGLNALKNKCNSQQWHDFAYELLTSSSFDPLPTEIHKQLVRMVLPTLSLPRMLKFQPEDFALCKKYYGSDEISEDTRTSLATVVAAQEGTMDQALAERIKQQVRILLPHEYIPGIHIFIPQFLQHGITPAAHRFMISAFFTRSFGYNVVFWQAYLKAWMQIFLQPATTPKAIEFLDFWFNVSPEKSPEKSYIVQEFFLRLPAACEELQKSQGFDTAVKVFHKAAAEQRWYFIVKGFFPVKAAMITRIKQFVAPQPEATNEPDEQEKNEVATFVALLFERGDEKKNHRQILKNYLIKDYALFWDYYRKNFISLFLRDQNQTLDLLSFWFDESFEHLNDMNYLPQAFFFHLSAMLGEVSGQQNFPAIAQSIEAIIARRKAPYPWYALLNNFFALSEKK